MNCENCRDECGAPNRARHEQEQEKEQEGCDRVKNDVGKMKRAGIRPEKLKLEHVRNVREWKTIRRRPMGERPRDVVPVQSTVDFWNFVDVFGIVAVPERLLDCLT